MIYYGDNLEVMDSLNPDSIDLIYIDPPFFCQRDFKNKEGIGFSDKWPSREAYLNFMRARLDRMHGLLKDTGVMALHCDQRISHHLRLMLDVVFGEKNFINEIIQHYSAMGGRRPKGYKKTHDNIFIYSKGSRPYIYAEKGPLADSTIARYKGCFNDKGDVVVGLIRKNDFKTYKTMVGQGRINERQGDNHVIMSKSKGTVLGDVWGINNSNGGSFKYPTQKPEKLLERIIKSFCPANGTVADFFCGSGTTLAIAQKLKRKWIGGDINKDAIKIANRRLMEEILK